MSPGIRVRPRFRRTIDLPPNQFEEKVQALLNQPAARCAGTVMPGFIILKIPMEQRHYWSPQLSLSVEEDNGKTLIRGLFGPNPSVWAIFFFGYASLAILAAFIAIIGFSQLSLDIPAPFLWVLPGLAAIALLLYLGAQAGQRLGAHQMDDLLHFLDEACAPIPSGV